MTNTVIFKWNPAISSYTTLDYLMSIYKEDIRANWSVWDYTKMHKGDTCFMLKVGYGITGIVAKGTITSEPYTDRDWSGKGRTVYYCDFKYQIMINPETFNILSEAVLQDEIPDFEWHGGHSGLVLSSTQAHSLNKL